MKTGERETHSEKRDEHARDRRASKSRTEIEQEVLLRNVMVPRLGSPVYIIHINEMNIKHNKIRLIETILGVPLVCLTMY